MFEGRGGNGWEVVLGNREDIFIFFIGFEECEVGIKNYFFFSCWGGRVIK